MLITIENWEKQLNISFDKSVLKDLSLLLTDSLKITIEKGMVTITSTDNRVINTRILFSNHTRTQ